jgi:ribosomal protein S12 methylthiotransferase accessory factor
MAETQPKVHTESGGAGTGKRLLTRDNGASNIAMSSAPAYAPYHEIRLRPPLDDPEQLVCNEGILTASQSIPTPVRPPGMTVLGTVIGDFPADGWERDPALELRPRHGDGLEHQGTGRAEDEEGARLISRAEALERYSACVWSAREYRRAAAADLDERHVPPERWPRCSEAEYRHPKAVLAPPRDDVELTWVRGCDLADREPTWIPAAMVLSNYMGLRREERVCFPISTGCAVHEDLERALLGGLCEVIERDSIGLTWLRRPGLAPLSPTLLDHEARALIALKRRHYIETHLFDATTDVGVPVVYALDVARHATRGARFVGAACNVDPTAAATSALREHLVGRSVLGSDHELPEDPADFNDVVHGALYMGAPERAPAFDFLLTGLAQRAPSAPAPVPGATTRERLRWIVDRLLELDMHVVAVDMTTRELELLGLCGVKVIVPELQPISFQPVGQFRGHARLVAADECMTGRPRDLDDLNPWPQSFP